MLSSLATLVVLTQASPAPSCHTSGRSVACGYHCLAELGEVKCAQTPEGLCQRAEDRLVCWDPPEEVRLHAVTRKPQCKLKRGLVSCGYACATSETKLACAQTPWGVCTTRYDDVVCWDPAPATIHHFLEELQGAKCLTTESAFGCGWDCRTSRSEVMCAQTPRGRCAVQDGRLFCFDPPALPISHPPPSAQR